jgi:hypothetical protein
MTTTLIAITDKNNKRLVDYQQKREEKEGLKISKKYLLNEILTDFFEKKEDSSKFFKS